MESTLHFRFLLQHTNSLYPGVVVVQTFDMSRNVHVIDSCIRYALKGNCAVIDLCVLNFLLLLFLFLLKIGNCLKFLLYCVFCVINIRKCREDFKIAMKSKERVKGMKVRIL